MPDHISSKHIAAESGVAEGKSAGKSIARRAIMVAALLGAATATVLVSPRAATVFRADASAAEQMPARATPPGFASIVDSVTPAVVSIRVRIVDDEHSQMERYFRGQGTGQMERGRARLVTSQGSGFFVSADGYAVTNNHVVNGAKTAEIRTEDNQVYTARIVAADPTSDLALLKVDGAADFPHVNFADVAPRVGDWIITVGNPFGLGGTVTAGIVSARGRDMTKDSYEDLLQIDAPVNKGSSGGPTFDVSGNVVGINTMIYSLTGGSVGIAFDIPADRARAVIAQLKDRGAVTRGWLGVKAQAVTPEIAETLGLAANAGGVLVVDVEADSPAAKVGISAGDVIQTMNGELVKDAHDFARKLDGMTPGTSLPLGVIQEAQERTVTAAVEEAPVRVKAAEAAPTSEATAKTDVPGAGLTLLPAQSVKRGTTGVIVAEIDPGSVLADRLDVGDIILGVAHRSVNAPEDVYTAITAAQGAGKRAVLMRIKSGETTRYVAVRIS